MKRLIWLIVVISLVASSVSAQSNKIVFGPLLGDDAGTLTVRNGEEIEVELWVRTDPQNPVPIDGVAHGLMSEDAIIAERNGMDPEPEYSMPYWEMFFIDTYVHDPDDQFPIPIGHTVEVQGAIYTLYNPPYPGGHPLDTQGEWDLYGTWLMVVNTDIPTDLTYFPFMRGWYPHAGQGNIWALMVPPGGTIEPEQSYCRLYLEPDTCIYLPGDVDRNGVPLEIGDVIAMIAGYRGLVEPYYLCECTEDLPMLDFAATADPNGNCIPNELNDVVTEIGAYRGTDEASGCVDCPGSP